MLKIVRSNNESALARLFTERRAQELSAERIARRIVTSVRRKGDAALLQLARELDGADLQREGFTVTRQEIRAAYAQTPKEFLAAVRIAARNIRATAKRQLPRGWMAKISPGIEVGQAIRPLDRVACYVPGGRFPLPSTVLMSVIPAQEAGVREIVVTSPRAAPAVCVTADFLGVKKIYRLGGAQAIAAFAFGTESVPRADKIVGPGNRYVAAAKKLVAGDCGIDFVAGPTELVVVGSAGRAAWIASDLVAQAEHDPDASAIFITSSMKLAIEVQSAAQSSLKKLRSAVAEASLRRRGAIILTKGLAESIELANRLAPEHLTLLDDAASSLSEIRSAGAIFLGGSSPVAAGDYASGGNHILPTAGAARVRGGLTAADFVKSISVQRLSRSGLRDLGRTIITLAEAEGLRAHAQSIEARFENDPRA
ncbi:MAG: histidinol dehydrogenase [Acidobacteriota bacterium]|nr:histidinol dehydrogenase [Acidobacteriota bacterium]